MAQEIYTLSATGTGGDFNKPLVFWQPLSCSFGNLWVVYHFESAGSEETVDAEAEAEANAKAKANRLVRVVTSRAPVADSRSVECSPCLIPHSQHCTLPSNTRPSSVSSMPEAGNELGKVARPWQLIQILSVEGICLGPQPPLHRHRDAPVDTNNHRYTRQEVTDFWQISSRSNFVDTCTACRALMESGTTCRAKFTEPENRFQSITCNFFE